MRGGIKIKPQGGERVAGQKVSAPAWLGEVARKIAVQPAKSDSEEVYSRMQAIMNGGNKLRYSSVEEAVRDYQKKTGLDSYLKTIRAEKLAKQIIKSSEADIFVKFPNIKNFVDQIIAHNAKIGDNSVLSVISKVAENFPNIGQENFDTPEFTKYISDKLANSFQDHNNYDYDQGLAKAVTAPPVSVVVDDPFVHARGNGSR